MYIYLYMYGSEPAVSIIPLIELSSPSSLLAHCFSCFCLLFVLLYPLRVIISLFPSNTDNSPNLKLWKGCNGSKQVVNWPSAIGWSLVPGDVTVCCTFQRMTPAGTENRWRGDGRYATLPFTSRWQASRRFGFWSLFITWIILHARWKVPLPQDFKDRWAKTEKASETYVRAWE